MFRLFAASTAVCALSTAPTLAQNVFELDEIVFSGNLTPVEADSSGVTVAVITAEDLEQAGDAQLSDYLERLPGINVVRDGPAGSSTGVRIRGLSDRYIAVRINGIDVSDPSNVQSFFNFGGLSTANISRIEVLYGSQSALYGSEAIAGVINIETTPIPDELGTETSVAVEAGSFETFSGAASVGTRFDRGTLGFSVERFVTDGFSAADENLGNTEADGHRSTTIGFRGSYDLTEAVTIGFDTLWLDTFTEFDAFAGAGGDGPQTGDAEIWATRVYATAQIGVVDNEFSLSRTETNRFFPLGFTQNFSSERTEFRYLGSYDLNADSTVAFGLEYSEESFSADATTGSVEIASAFADLTWGVSPDIDLSFSGRVDDHSRFGTQPTLRAALAWRPDDVTVVRASIGQGARAPSLFELFSSFGDPTLDPETSVSVELGVERDFGNLSLGATAFWIQIDDLIDFDGGATACGSGFGCYNQVPGLTTTQGIELSGAYDFDNGLTVFSNYTYTDTETAAGERLARVPLHQVNLGVAGDFASGFGFEVLGTGAFDTEVSPFAPQPLDDYFVFDATASYDLTDSVETYIRVENLLDEEYQISPGFGTSDRAFYLGLRATF